MEVLWTKLCPSNSYVETLILNVMIVFRDRAFRKAIKVKGVHKGGAFMRRRRDSRELSLRVHTQGKAHANTQREGSGL